MHMLHINSKVEQNTLRERPSPEGGSGLLFRTITLQTHRALPGSRKVKVWRLKRVTHFKRYLPQESQDWTTPDE